MYDAFDASKSNFCIKAGTRVRRSVELRTRRVNQSSAKVNFSRVRASAEQIPDALRVCGKEKCVWPHAHAFDCVHAYSICEPVWGSLNARNCGRFFDLLIFEICTRNLDILPTRSRIVRRFFCTENVEYLLCPDYMDFNSNKDKANLWIENATEFEMYQEYIV